MALLLRGALVNLTNPRGLVFLLAVLPQFVVLSCPLRRSSLTIAATMVVVDVLVMCAYTGLASRLLGWLRTRANNEPSTAPCRTVRGCGGGAVPGASGRHDLNRQNGLMKAQDHPNNSPACR